MVRRGHVGPTRGHAPPRQETKFDTGSTPRVRAARGTAGLRSSGLSRKVPELLVAMAERALLCKTIGLGRACWKDGSNYCLTKMASALTSIGCARPDGQLSGFALATWSAPRHGFPPGAHRWMGLARRGAARPVDAKHLVLRPHFLARLAMANAKSALIHASSAVWGDALLAGEASASVGPNCSSAPRPHRSP